MLPTHEFVDAAELRYQFLAWAEMEMEGVDEESLNAAVFELLRCEGFCCCGGCDGKEGGRFDGAGADGEGGAPCAFALRINPEVQQGSVP